MPHEGPASPGGKQAIRPAVRVSLVAMVVGGLASAVGFGTASCSSDTTDSPSVFDASASTSSSSGSSGVFPDSGLVPVDDGGTSGGPVNVKDGGECTATVAEAKAGRRPADIIFVIDNSHSMDQEISEVENQINDNFAAVLAAAAADYKVIMVSGHGLHSSVETVQRICVRSPLSGTSCALGPTFPPHPVPGDRFVHHSIPISSLDSWCKLLTSFSGPDEFGEHLQGWGSLLRPSAFKVFAIITDDRIKTTCNVNGGTYNFDDQFDSIASAKTSAQTFDSAMIALSPQFGLDVAHRNYVWHSIIGISIFDTNDTNKPHPPDAPTLKTLCSPNPDNDAGADAFPVSAGLAYQELSKLTGGLRFPTCGLNYNPIFRKMADDVIAKTVVDCEYLIPPNPDGGTIDLRSTTIRYTSGTNAPVYFEQVASESLCGNAANKFYVSGDRIKVCPTACNALQNDPAANVKILYGCLGPDGTVGGIPK